MTDIIIKISSLLEKKSNKITNSTKLSTIIYSNNAKCEKTENIKKKTIKTEKRREK